MYIVYISAENLILAGLYQLNGLTLDEVSNLFDTLYDWCNLNLVKDTWYFHHYIPVDYGILSTHFPKCISFVKEEDALAFKLRFGDVI